MVRVIGMAISLASVAGIAFAGVVIVRVPEIDASSGAAAIGLIAGGLLILRSRRKKS